MTSTKNEAFTQCFPNSLSLPLFCSPRPEMKAAAKQLQQPRHCPKQQPFCIPDFHSQPTATDKLLFRQALNSTRRLPCFNHITRLSAFSYRGLITVPSVVREAAFTSEATFTTLPEVEARAWTTFLALAFAAPARVGP